MRYQKILLATSALALAASVSTAAITLDPVTAGASVSVTGSGASANGPVELWVNNVSQGSLQADGSGNFTFSGLNIADGDVLVATASQVWNFNTDGDAEGWFSPNDTLVIAGGKLTLTEAGADNNITFALGGDNILHDQDLARVIEIRYSLNTAPSGNGIFLTGFAGADTVSGGGDDTFPFGQSWNAGNMDTSGNMVTFTQDYQTLDSGSRQPLWDTENCIQIGFGMNLVAAGAVMEIDSIRMAESFDWDFRADNDAMGWTAGPGCSALTVAGGTLTYSNTTASVNAYINRPFQMLDSTVFTVLETRVDRQTGQAGQLEYFQWLDSAGFSDNDSYQFLYTDGSGFEVNTIDLTNAAGSIVANTDWGQNPTTLNNFGGTYSSHFPPTANEVTVVDYIRLRPAVVYGPSAAVTATASAGVENWEMFR